jgi:hypothetical protein
MSHFTVMVIGKDPKKQLAPFDENLENEWIDETKEFQEEYDTKKVPEFFDESSSSWGFEITRELFDLIKRSKVGMTTTYVMEKQPMSYLRAGKRYRGYYPDNGKRCKGDVWFEIVTVLKTTHPDPDICSEGIVVVRKITPPKQIRLKDKYPDYNTYLRDWHSIKDISKQGYWTNAKAKWDWYKLGGRWTGILKLKDKAKGQTGEPGIMTKPAKKGWVDQALKKDIDFEGMLLDSFEKATARYDAYLEKVKSGEKVEPYWDFGIENKGTRENPRLETREEYIKSNATFCTFAVLKDGKWYQRGEMGWWGCVHDEKPEDNWTEEFKNLFNSLPEDTLISIYDCHI